VRQHRVLQQTNLRGQFKRIREAVEFLKEGHHTVVLPRSTLLLPMRALHTAEAIAPDGQSGEKARENDAEDEEREVAWRRRA
jgi:hypothetical protein